MSVLSEARAAPPATEPLTVVPVRRPWRWVGAAAVLVLVAQFAHGLITNPGWDWATFAGYFFEKSVMQALLLVNLLKSTSVVCVLAIGELFYQVQVVYGRNGRVVPLLLVATVWYVILTAVLSVFQHYVERHFSKGWRR